ncbi:MAG: alpha-glucan family phosphorylase [Prolixibacteraceae bacterium]|nr:alpha-glucan family phosphorylase [Prolixibacteraceae bacterium]
MKSESVNYIKQPVISNPVWKKIVVESSLPESLSPLKVLSRNLWWVWNSEARELFQFIDAQIWEECEHNPVVLLDEVSYERIQELEKDEVFLSKMHRVYQHFKDYIDERQNPEGPEIAYFSMEYGLHDCLKIFSGGLGILAGDYLKEASDSNVNLIAVGLLYRYGYFKQTLNLHGEQMANYEAQHFSKIPVLPAVDGQGNWIEVEIQYPGRPLVAKVWLVEIGKTKLYLLDADHQVNQEQDRSVTHHLYGGDNENRLKQEMLLGLGGIKALRKLGYNSDIYHCNEGHAAFIGVERIAGLIENEGLTFAEAKEVVRASTVFTTHTPVPAGHDSFHINMFKHYMNDYAGKLGLQWEEFEMLGKANSQEDHFNMSYLASHMSQGINGVSMLHGDVSKDVLRHMYPGFLTEELEIGYVTNGVHYSTWTAQEWKNIHKKYFGESFPSTQLDFDVWKNIYNVPNEEIWELRRNLRLKLINYIKVRFSDNWIKRHEDPKLITEVMGKLNPNALTIGFARRFATYKRGYLLFRNLERLAKIVNNPEKPVQFIFAGKAHPADKAGQDLIKYIVEISKKPEFRGKILFVQNYDMNLAKMLLQGVDVWLNTPTRPLEASGTSGEKGVMNGTMHFSVLDGWWVEGYRENAGWALPAERSYDVQDFQDELDAETIYSILENEVTTAFYSRNNYGIPEKWIEYIKNTIAQVAPNFTTGRMIRDYKDRYYNPQYNRTKKIKADNFKIARDMAAWKYKISSIWDQIEVTNVEFSDGITNKMVIGQNYPIKVFLDLKGLSCNDIGVELVITENDTDKPSQIVESIEFNAESCDGNICCYTYQMRPNHPGAFNYGFRIFPKNENLPHRQDFAFVKWV